MAQVFKNPAQQADDIEEENIYNEWQNSVLNDDRKSRGSMPMATRLADAPLKKMDDASKQYFFNLHKDKPEDAQKVADKLAGYENVVDKYAADLESIADQHGGQMSGLEYRLKRPDSIYNKVYRDFAEAKENARKNNEPEPTLDFNKSLEDMRDIARFTMVFDSNGFQEGVNKAMASMTGRGYKPTKFSSSFEDGARYKGLNTAFADPDGRQFELQFHTPESIKIKEGIDFDFPNRKLSFNHSNITSHDIYEATRALERKKNEGTITPQEERLYNVLLNRSIKMWAGIPNYQFDYKID